MKQDFKFQLQYQPLVTLTSSAVVFMHLHVRWTAISRRRCLSVCMFLKANSLKIVDVYVIEQLTNSRSLNGVNYLLKSL